MVLFYKRYEGVGGYQFSRKNIRPYSAQNGNWKSHGIVGHWDLTVGLTCNILSLTAKFSTEVCFFDRMTH